MERTHDARLVGWLSSPMVRHDLRPAHDDCVHRGDRGDHCMGVARALGLGWRSDFQGVNTPLDTLKHRFARGEIDRAEYEERKKLLLGS
jgi:hypothetical protein